MNIAAQVSFALLIGELCYVSYTSDIGSDVCVASDTELTDALHYTCHVCTALPLTAASLNQRMTSDIKLKFSSGYVV